MNPGMSVSLGFVDNKCGLASTAPTAVICRLTGGDFAFSFTGERLVLADQSGNAGTITCQYFIESNTHTQTLYPTLFVPVIQFIMYLKTLAETEHFHPNVGLTSLR